MTQTTSSKNRLARYIFGAGAVVVVLNVGAAWGYYVHHPGVVTKTVTVKVPEVHTITKTVKVPEVHTVTKTVTKTVKEVPKSCITAINLTHTIVNNALEIDNESSATMDTMHNGWLAVSSGNYLQINRVLGAMTRIQDQTLNAVQGLSNEFPQWNTSIRECRNDVNGTP